LDPDARASFERLYTASYDRVLAYLVCRTNLDGAVEAAAQVFLVAWRRFAELPDDPLPWLFGVARRVLADQRRSTARRQALSDRLAAERYGTRLAEDPADALAERDALLEALARLGERDREVLALIAWDGLTPRQAAASLGCSPAAFAVRLHRARRRLTRQLSTEPPVRQISLERASPPGQLWAEQVVTREAR
jgi:RNA polymerase sigma-70 factor (ECF subfamily)